MPASPTPIPPPFRNAVTCRAVAAAVAAKADPRFPSEPLRVSACPESSREGRLCGEIPLPSTTAFSSQISTPRAANTFLFTNLQKHRGCGPQGVPK